MSTNSLPPDSDAAINGYQNEQAVWDVAFLERVMRFQDGALVGDQLTKFEAELLTDENKRRAFAELQLRSIAIQEAMRRDAFGVEVVDADGSSDSCGQVAPRLGSEFRSASSTPKSPLPSLWLMRSWGSSAVMTAAVLVLAVLLVWPRGDSRDVRNPPKELIGQNDAKGSARLTGASRAQFFGQAMPEVQSLLDERRDYVLTSGLVELAFPTGATAIVEGPAVFRILGAESLALDLGRCSVHAPDGAEGFRVETPMNRIVDRGTRFSVSVAETSETEVHVVEGAADVYRRPGETRRESVSHDNEKLPLQVRLTDRESRRFESDEAHGTTALQFAPDHYRRQLPDRVIAYEATTATNGGAENLVSVTLQLGGQVQKFAVEDLIPVELTSFKSSPGKTGVANLIGGLNLPEQRQNWLSDRALNTGVINPGGHVEPLTHSPILLDPEDPARPNTPGFAVRFRSPVVNAPGPDVVFFDVQCWNNPIGGDAFHVSPLDIQPRHRSHTIRTYDLTMTSPAALKVASFHLHQFPRTVDSLHDLESFEFIRRSSQISFRGLVAGIDLSDLGFAEGESAEGLFFQDAQDDEHVVDPVFIAGVPRGAGGK